MKLRLQAVVLLVTVAASTGGEALGASAINWRTDLAAAQAEAQQSGKLVLLHFWTERCGPCRLLDKRVFSMPSVANAIEANYVPVKVNAAVQHQLTQAYEISRVPTDVVVTPEGEVVKTFVSPATPMAYVGHTAEVAAEYKSQQGTQYNSIAKAAPYTPNTSGVAPQTSTPPALQVNPAYAHLASNPQTASSPKPATPSVVAPASPAMTSAAPQTASKPLGDRYDMGAIVPGYSAPPATVAAAPSTPAAKPAPQGQPSRTANPYYKNQPESQGPATAPKIAEPASDLPTPPAPKVASAVQTSASEAPEESPVVKDAAGVALPKGSPPLGFEGYCPVTMKREWRWQQGDVRWGAIHRGRTYLFSSQKCRDEFLRSPDDYSPALEGADPVLAVEGRQSVPGTRDYALEYNGRFYLFSSEETLNKFWSDAEGYVTGVERVAAGVSADQPLVR